MQVEHIQKSNDIVLCTNSICGSCQHRKVCVKYKAITSLPILPPFVVRFDCYDYSKTVTKTVRPN